LITIQIWETSISFYLENENKNVGDILFYILWHFSEFYNSSLFKKMKMLKKQKINLFK